MPAVSGYSPTGNAYVDGVLGGVKWAVSSLTFSFPADGAFYGSPYAYGEPTNNFEALTTLQQDTVRSILQMYSTIINVSFVETTETASVHGDLRFAESDAVSTAWAYYPTTSALGGDVWFNNSKNTYDNPVKGNYAYVTMMHEIGHALGLKHPHEASGLFSAMPADRDSLEYTIMSYRSDVGAGTGYTNAYGSYPTTLMMYDIAALQRMYGANYNTNSGNSVYRWSTTTGEMSINGVGQGALAANKIFMTLWDGGGEDTYDFSNYATNLTVNLNPGEWTTVSTAQLANLSGSGVAVGNIANAFLYNNNTASLIENAVGGSGNDAIVGNSASNKLTGNAGNDSLDGGAGSDTAIYTGAYLNYQLVYNSNGTWNITDLRGGSPDGSDTLLNMEWVQFSDTSVLLESVLNSPQNPVPVISSVSNDTGTAGDRITNDNTLTLSGTAGSSAVVKIFDSGALIGSVTADAAGQWTFTTAVLGDGAHAFSATGTDANGNTSAASTVLTVTVDTVAPTVPTISGYSPDSAVTGDGLTNASTVTLFGTAEASSLVHVYDGAILLGTATANASGQWSFKSYDPAAGQGAFAFACGCAACGRAASQESDVILPQPGDGITGVLNDGLHVFTAIAVDAAGNSSAASSALNVTIDTAPPAAPTISSFSNDSGVAGDNTTSDNTLTFTGTAQANSTVRVYDGATLLGTVTANGSGAWSYTTAALADGGHSFTATASDAAGNTSAASAALSVTVDTAAPAAPTVTAFSNDSGVVGDGVTNDNTLTLNGTAQANSTVSVYDGATLLGTVTANGSGAWSYTTAALADGAHSFTVTAADAAGNTSTASAALSVTVDTAAPSAPSIASWSNDSGVSGDGITNDNTLTFTGTAQANSTVRVYDGATLLGTVTANGSGAWSYTTAALADGAHSFTATAADAAGNTSTASAALSVTVDTAAPSAPTIASWSNDSGVTGDGITNDNTLTFTGTAQANSTVSVYDGATLLGTVTANGSGTWSYTTAALADGAHSFTATAADAAGNTSTASAALSVTVDTAAPSAPTITSWSNDSGVAGDGTTNDNTLTFTGTAQANSTVSVYDGATLLGTVTANGSGAWSYSTAILAGGAHSFTATAADAAGNTSAPSAALSVTVDTAAPSVPTIASWSNDSGVAGDGVTNDNTLALTGTAEANSTVSIYDGATLLGTVTANGSGAWSYTTATLAVGAHSFTATAADAAGNTSAPSAALSVTVDTAAPSVPTIASWSNDSGVAGDGVTNDNTLALTGTAEANSTVRLYDGATLLGTVTANGSGAWSYTTATLADGAHSFTATAADVAGNNSASSAALNVTVDTAAPSAPTIASWSNDSGVVGDGITNDNTLALTGTAAANSTVSIYDGATLLGTVTANGSGAWSYTTSALVDGAHSFTAAIADPAGNTAVSAALNVTIDTGAPAAPSIASWSNDSGVVGDGTTNDNTLTFAGTAQANSTVRLYDGATLLGTATANGSGAWSFTTAALTDGSHSFTATAADATGNTSAPSAALSVTVDTVAPGAPTIASWSNDSGVVGDGITNDNTLSFTGTAQANSTVRLYDGATLLGTVTANGSGTWSYTTAALSDGTHSFTAAATDAAGNTSAASAALSITINSGAPAAPTIASWSNDSGVVGDGLTSDNTLTLTGSAQANSTVSVYDGATLLGTVTANGSGAWSYTTAALTDGAHSFTATATDAAGNTGSVSTALSVTVDTAAPGAPIIASFSSDTGVPGDSVTNDNTLTLTGSSQANSTVQVYDGGVLLGTAAANGSGAWSYTTAALADGAHSFTAVAVDAAGNTGAASSALSVTVDTQAPGAPTIASFSSDSGVAGDNITSDNTLTFTGTAQANSTVRIYDGATLLGTVTANGSGAWSYTTAALADGGHSFTATASDAAGNTSTASAALTVTVDIMAPAAPTITSFSNDSGVVGDAITNDNTLTLTGSAEANSTVSVYDGATLLGTVAANGSGAWSYTTATLTDGAHSFTARVADAAGNTGTTSAPLSVTIDTGAPTAPTIASWSNDSGVVGDGITSDNTLTFTGTAQANTTVRLYDGATLLGTVTANGSGAWSYTTAALADGAHSFTATAADAAGNISATSAALSITVDATAPGAPTIASFSSDSGVAGDNVTNDNTLTFSGTAQANSTVRLYDGAALLGTVTANGSGAWSYSTAALADGAHSFTATASDVAGNTSATSAALTVTVDTTAPTAPTIASFSRDSGIVGDGVTNDKTLTFTGSAEANSTVQVYDGGVLLGTATANGSGSWNYTTAALADGGHSFTATAVDAAGNTGSASSALNITIDTAAPGIPTIKKVAASNAAGQGFTTDDVLIFTGTAQTNSAVKIYDGSTLLGTVTADGSGEWTYTSSPLGTGVHSVTAIATDEAGNDSTASSALSVTVNTVSPADLVVESISAPLSVVQGAALNFSYVVKNNGGINAGLHWSGIAIDGQVTETNYRAYDTISSLAAGASVTFNNSISTAGLSVGQHTLYIKEDYWYNGISESNETNNVRAVTFNVTAMAPADLTVESISAPLSVTQGANLNFSYVIKNIGGSQAGLHWSGIAVDGQVTETNYQAYDTISSLAAGASVTFNNSISTAGLSVGQHTLYIKDDYWYNLIGESNESNNVRSITFNVTAAGVAAPTITSFSNDSGVVGDRLTNDNTLTLVGSAAANSSVHVYDGATLLGTAIANSNGAWSYNTAVLTDGSHSFTATASLGGNTSAASAAFSIMIDTLAPGVPTISSFSNDTGAVGDGITSDNTLTLTGNAQANSIVRVYDGAALLGTATANGSGTWTYTTAVLSDGNHSFTASSTDLAGNTSTASSALSVTVNTLSPADLVVESISAPLSVLQGAALNFSYVVKNNGGTNVGLHWSGIAIDSQVTETNYRAYDTISSLAAGASVTFNNSISTAGLSVGQHTLYIKEDYWYNLIGESNESNNVRSITFNVTAVTPADLTVESISAPLSVTQGANLNFSYVIKNIGGSQAGLHWSGIAVDGLVSETNYQAYDTISSLAAGASATFNNSISTAGLSVGQHTLYIKDDYWYNLIGESNESNNVRSITFNVTAAGATAPIEADQDDHGGVAVWLGAVEEDDSVGFAASAVQAPEDGQALDSALQPDLNVGLGDVIQNGAGELQILNERAAYIQAVHDLYLI